MPYMQIYLLTVLSSLLAGLCLSRQMLAEKFENFKPFSELLDNSMFQLVVGIVSVLTGIFSLFKFSPADIVILGDLIPSLMCIAVGFLLINDYLAKDEGEGFLVKLAQFSRERGAIVGIISMSVGLIHAIIPTALFL